MACLVVEVLVAMWSLTCRLKDLSLWSTLRGTLMITDLTIWTWTRRFIARTLDLSPWICPRYSPGIMSISLTSLRLKMQAKYQGKMRKSWRSSSSTKSSIVTINLTILPLFLRNVSTISLTMAFNLYFSFEELLSIAWQEHLQKGSHWWKTGESSQYQAFHLWRNL